MDGAERIRIASILHSICDHTIFASLLQDMDDQYRLDIAGTAVAVAVVV